MTHCPRKTNEVMDNMPNDFDQSTVDTIFRIITHPNVIGAMFFRNYNIHMSTLPQSMTQQLCSSLPRFSKSVYQAIADIDVLDELIAYRIESLNNEIMVVGGEKIGACAVQKRTPNKKAKHHRHYTK